jgi:hypothetical protein
MLYSFVDFLSMNGDFLRRADAESNLITLYAEHGDSYLVPNPNDLSDPSCQYQHLKSSLKYLKGSDIQCDVE